MADQPTTGDLVTGNPSESQSLNHLLEQQRQFTSRLRQQFAAALRAVGPQGPLRDAARYVQQHYVERIAAGLDEFVEKQPAASVAAAFLAGYLVGRALRPR
jgi:ElaB/YqjD/DUF883 family membrane-anchored ribosome-binding protein